MWNQQFVVMMILKCPWQTLTLWSCLSTRERWTLQTAGPTLSPWNAYRSKRWCSCSLPEKRRLQHACYLPTSFFLSHRLVRCCRRTLRQRRWMCCDFIFCQKYCVTLWTLVFWCCVLPQNCANFCVASAFYLSYLFYLGSNCIHSRMHCCISPPY